MNKKSSVILTIILVLAMALSLVACGGGADTDKTDGGKEKASLSNAELVGQLINRVKTADYSPDLNEIFDGTTGAASAAQNAPQNASAPRNAVSSDGLTYDREDVPEAMSWIANKIDYMSVGATTWGEDAKTTIFSFIDKAKIMDTWLDVSPNENVGLYCKVSLLAGDKIVVCTLNNGTAKQYTYYYDEDGDEVIDYQSLKLGTDIGNIYGEHIIYVKDKSYVYMDEDNYSSIDNKDGYLTLMDMQIGASENEYAQMFYAVGSNNNYSLVSCYFGDKYNCSLIVDGAERYSYMAPGNNDLFGVYNFTAKAFGGYDKITFDGKSESGSDGTFVKDNVSIVLNGLSLVGYFKNGELYTTCLQVLDYDFYFDEDKGELFTVGDDGALDYESGQLREGYEGYLDLEGERPNWVITKCPSNGLTWANNDEYSEFMYLRENGGAILDKVSVLGVEGWRTSKEKSAQICDKIEATFTLPLYTAAQCEQIKSTALTKDQLPEETVAALSVASTTGTASISQDGKLNFNGSATVSASAYMEQNKQYKAVLAFSTSANAIVELADGEAVTYNGGDLTVNINASVTLAQYAMSFGKTYSLSVYVVKILEDTPLAITNPKTVAAADNVGYEKKFTDAAKGFEVTYSYASADGKLNVVCSGEDSVAPTLTFAGQGEAAIEADGIDGYYTYTINNETTLNDIAAAMQISDNFDAGIKLRLSSFEARTLTIDDEDGTITEDVKNEARVFKKFSEKVMGVSAFRITVEDSAGNTATIGIILGMQA